MIVSSIILLLLIEQRVHTNFSIDASYSNLQFIIAQIKFLKIATSVVSQLLKNKSKHIVITNV